MARPAAGEHRPDVLDHAVVAHQRHAHHLGDGLPGDVVLGRAEPAADDHGVAAGDGRPARRRSGRGCRPPSSGSGESIPAIASCSPIQLELVSTTCPSSSSVPTATTSQRMAPCWHHPVHPDRPVRPGGAPRAARLRPGRPRRRRPGPPWPSRDLRLRRRAGGLGWAPAGGGGDVAVGPRDDLAPACGGRTGRARRRWPTANSSCSAASVWPSSRAAIGSICGRPGGPARTRRPDPSRPPGCDPGVTAPTAVFATAPPAPGR